jgi:hypothetical protein
MVSRYGALSASVPQGFSEPTQAQSGGVPFFRTADWFFVNNYGKRIYEMNKFFEIVINISLSKNDYRLEVV